MKAPFRHLFLVGLMVFIPVLNSLSQVSINTTGGLPDNSAMLDVKSSSRGILVPRMTQTERDAIAAPATGLLIYQTEPSPGFYFNSGTSSNPVWEKAVTSSGIELLESRISSLENALLNIGSIDYDGDGFTLNTGDCDETNNQIHPGMQDDCEDGIDQNCDGVDLPCSEDSDNDGIANSTDNCPTVANPDQNDADDDGIGDLCDVVADYDGNTYNVVKIGIQLWFKENLKVTHYLNGDQIPNISDGAEWSGLTSGAYCDYDNNPVNSQNFYRLYNWYTVADSRLLCPEGWHVANGADYQTLSNFLETQGYGFEGDGNDIAKSLSSQTGWTSSATPGTPGNDQATNNSSGFSAIPGGRRTQAGNFVYLNQHSILWDVYTFETLPSSAYILLLRYDNTGINTNPQDKNEGYGIRCVNDNFFE